MKPKEPVKTGQRDMFRSRLDQIIDMRHEKIVLADQIDWQFLSDKCGENYTDKPGRPYDGHTLKTILPEIEAHTGATLKRILADAG